jgi:hypothetical protein
MSEGGHKDDTRASVIKAVTSPLSLFALVVLAIEAILLVLATTAPERVHQFISYSMVSAFIGLIVVFIVLAVFKPDVFYSDSSRKELAEEQRIRDAETKGADVSRC